MEVIFEQEYPDEQVPNAVQWLQNLAVGLVAHLQQRKKNKLNAISQNHQTELSEAEQKVLLYKVFGGWQSDASGEDMVRQIYGDRRDSPREVNL